MSKILGIFLMGIGVVTMYQNQLIPGAIIILLGFCLLPSRPGEYGQ